MNPSELLYFADICAGPGGFSEYVLWRSKAEAKGFGMTLRGPCDFKLEDFFAGPAEMFEPYYGKDLVLLKEASFVKMMNMYMSLNPMQ